MSRNNQMNFVAIDFETANPSRASVCQTGVAIVRNGTVKDVQEWVVQPPTGLDNFNPRNSRIHRITPRMAAKGLLWGESAERLTELIGDLPVIAHNAPFDRSVYLAACETLGLQSSDWSWYCSLAISKEQLQLPRHSLDHVAGHLSIDIGDHHQAGSDAYVAAEILLAISRGSGVGHLQELSLELPPPGRRPRRATSSAAATSIPAHTISGYTKVSDLPKANADADPDHPLHSEHVVLSGKVGEHSRDFWIDRLAELGAQSQLNVTKKTTLVVLGADAGKGKVAAADKRRAEGQHIETISADQLTRLLGPVPSTGPNERSNDQEEMVGEPRPPYESSSSSPSDVVTSIETHPDAAATPVHEPEVMNFQYWSRPPGSLPSGWTLTLQHRGGQRRISTSMLNRNPTGLFKRIGAFVGIILGSLVLSAALVPLLGPVVPVVLLGGIAYSLIHLFRSAGADRLRRQYWAGTPEPRIVLNASTRRGVSPPSL